MAHNITYLFGAGASANALPTIASMSTRMEYFFKLVKKAFEILGDSIGDYDLTRDDYYRKFLDDINLAGTPDTIIRVQDIVGDNWVNLNRIFLAAYIIYEQLPSCNEQKNQLFSAEDENQIWKSLDLPKQLIELPFYHSNTLDRRFIELITSLINPRNLSKHLPANVQFLTWNYDHQIEKAFHLIEPRSTLSIQKKHKIIPRTDEDDTSWNGAKIKEEYSNSKILKLNGTAGFVSSSNYSLFDLTREVNDKRVWRKLLNLLYSHSKPGAREQKLMMAWDNTYDALQECRIQGTQILSITDVLVVVGYSFPNFNRFIDRSLFEQFDLNNKKVIIQDPNADEICAKLDGVKRGLRKIAIPIKSSGSFIIPDEFWEN